MRAQLFALVLVPCLLNPAHADCGCEGGLVRWLFTVMCGPWCAAPDGAEESAAPSNRYEQTILAQWRDLWQRGKLDEAFAVIEKAATIQPQSRDIQHARAVTLAVRDAERHGPLPSATWRAVKNGPQLTFIVSFGPVLEGTRLDGSGIFRCDDHEVVVAQVIEDAKTLAATPFALRKSEGDEKPGILRAIAFKNLEKVSEQSLRDLLRMEIGKRFDDVRPWEDFIRVEEYLRGIGYLQSRVKMDVIHRDGETRVIFDIDEGPYSLPRETSEPVTVVPIRLQLEKTEKLIECAFSQRDIDSGRKPVPVAQWVGSHYDAPELVTDEDYRQFPGMWIDYSLPPSLRLAPYGWYCPAHPPADPNFVPTVIASDRVESPRFRAHCHRVEKTDDPDVYLLRGPVQVECRAFDVPIFLWSGAVKVNVKTGTVQAMNVLLRPQFHWGIWDPRPIRWKACCLGFEPHEMTKSWFLIPTLNGEDSLPNLDISICVW